MTSKHCLPLLIFVFWGLTHITACGQKGPLKLPVDKPPAEQQTPQK